MNRNLGLDIVRSIAIIMVLISHGRKFFSIYVDLESLSVLGVLGVEIFFVLSGFLIGKIIIREILEQQTLNSLWNFYVRRWFRTLPLYYSVLIGVIILNYLTGNPDFSFLNFIFLQNYDLEALRILDISWSLAVEEWFYLLFPLLFLFVMKVWRGKKVTVFFLFTISFIALENLGRILYVVLQDPSFNFGIRINTFLRLDSIAIGVLLAGVKFYFKDFYNKVTNRSAVLISVSIIGFISASIYFQFLTATNTLESSNVAMIALFPFISVCCVLFIAYFDTSIFVNVNLKNHILSRVFTFVSLTSYCVYLIHNYIFYKFIGLSQSFGNNYLVSILLFLVALTVIFAFAYLSFKYFENPILKIRDKFAPKIKNEYTEQKSIKVAN
ncbi:TPA: acyltransferase [Yersinia enterocolitica]|nr:acyltransferase [Yersinia enterocolitica]